MINEVYLSDLEVKMNKTIKFIYYYIHSLYHYNKATIKLTYHSIISIFKSDNYKEYLNLTYYILSGAFTLHKLSKDEEFKKIAIEIHQEIIKKYI